MAGKITRQELSAGLKSELNNIGNKAETITHTAIITTTNWIEEDGYYTQEIEVLGILETDNPIIDILAGEDVEEDVVIMETWGNVYRIETDDDKIIVYSFNDFETEIPIQIKVVR